MLRIRSLTGRVAYTPTLWRAVWRAMRSATTGQKVAYLVPATLRFWRGFPC